MDLRATWVHLGAILGHPGVIVELSWEDLEATWVHIGLRTSCEVEMFDFIKVLCVFEGARITAFDLWMVMSWKCCYFVGFMSFVMQGPWTFGL